MAVTMLLYQSQQCKQEREHSTSYARLLSSPIIGVAKSSAVTKVSDILVDLRLKTQKQLSILDFLEKRSNAKE